MRFSELDKELDLFLRPKDFTDFCPNGLLVDPFPGEDRKVSKVVTGVSLCDELIDRAAEAKADVLVVHHPNGFWKSEKDKRLVGTFGRYMGKLIRAGIALYGYHLPLDAHPVIGNNSCIALRLAYGNETGRFMEQGIGVTCSTIVNAAVLDNVFPKGWKSFGPALEDRTYRVGICSGSGTSGLQEAVDRGCDMFITGEIRESTPIFAKENKITVIAAGHHRSEVFGVKALAECIAEPGGRFHGCRARFIDIDNPI